MSSTQFHLLRQMHKHEDEEINDSPIEQVRLVVPITDDYTLPTLTFRTWIIGPSTCVLLAFATQFFFYRQNTIYISNSCVQMLVLAWGKMMAKTLPTKPVTVPGTNWSFSMNPGPFNIKEHILITILATSGLINPYAITILSMSKIFYGKSITFWPGLLMCQTTQLVGYGFAGIFMNFLVTSPYMWYPFTLVDVCLYRALHEDESRTKGQLTTLQFFFIAAVGSFAYAIIPGFFFPSIGALSFICWIWKKSVLPQIIGAGRGGFGIGSVALDWNAISSFFGNPLVFPITTVFNMIFGFVVFLYVVTPIVYWSDVYHVKRFPLSSSNFYDYTGNVYDISRILNKEDLTFNEKGYQDYSQMYLGALYLMAIGFVFAGITSSFVHFILFYGRDAWTQVKQAFLDIDNPGDVHNRLMKRYSRIPRWWFVSILVSMLGLSLFTTTVYSKELQLPYWGILLGCFLITILILPFGVLQATTGQTLNLGVTSEFSLGYFYPGRPIANLAFKSFCVSAMDNAINIFGELKLGHYMKIPPKNLFAVQVLGSLITSTVGYSTSWWLLSAMKNICERDKLPEGSPWTCPSEHVTFTNSVIWGVIGPSRIFFPNGLYSNLYYFFLIGPLATLFVWVLLQLFPEKDWIKNINVPVIFMSGLAMPAAGPVNFWSWAILALLFNFFVYKRHKVWWTKYNYVLAYGIDMGVALLAVLASFTLQLHDVYGVDWWGLDVGDHCPLATCPTAPNVIVDGCPVF